AKRRKCSILVAKLDRLSRRRVHLGPDVAPGAVHRRRARAGRRSVHATRLCCAGRAGASPDLTRTKAALAEAKRRGVRLGNPEQAKANRFEAEAHAEGLRPVLTELRDLTSRAIADRADQARHPDAARCIDDRDALASTPRAALIVAIDRGFESPARKIVRPAGRSVTIRRLGYV